MVPKSLALQRGGADRAWVTPPMLWIKTLLYPLVVALNAHRQPACCARRRQAAGANAEQYHTTEELQLIVEESQERARCVRESGQILQELFEFGDLTAGEVMVPRVRIVGIPVGTTPDELREISRATPHTRYPVFEGDLDHIVGSVHIKDLLRLLLANEPVDARDARPLPVVPETAPLDEVLAAMRRERAQMAVVMDEHGGTAGVVTLEDLFEEVVGDIEEGPASEGRIATLRAGCACGARCGSTSSGSSSTSSSSTRTWTA